MKTLRTYCELECLRQSAFRRTVAHEQALVSLYPPLYPEDEPDGFKPVLLGLTQGVAFVPEET